MILSERNMIDEKIWQGVDNLIDSYANIKTEDKVIIAYTKDSRESAAWVSHALDLRGVDVDLVWMKPLKDTGFFDRFTSVVPSKEELTEYRKLCIMTFEADTLSHTKEIRKALCHYDNNQYLVIRLISAHPELFSYALHADPEQLLARNATILQRCKQAKNLRIKCPGGTDLKVNLDSERFRWISNSGVCRQGDAMILPAGEVATYPECIEGTLVANFAFNLNIPTDNDVNLEINPVTVYLEKGKATHFKCDNKKIYDLVAKCFDNPNGVNVGELGFGTNYCIQDVSPQNSHINERRPGVHLGFGQHNQGGGRVTYECNTHIDLITRGGLIWVDEDSLPLDLDNIAPSLIPHPVDYEAEDAFAPDLDPDSHNDCCGIIS
jgi:leucyl aminopeptidase (aminopeptidase T)